jgi:hypothetical protein
LYRCEITTITLSARNAYTVILISCKGLWNLKRVGSVENYTFRP